MGLLLWERSMNVLCIVIVTMTKMVSRVNDFWNPQREDVVISLRCRTPLQQMINQSFMKLFTQVQTIPLVSPQNGGETKGWTIITVLETTLNLCNVLFPTIWSISIYCTSTTDDNNLFWSKLHLQNDIILENYVICCTFLLLQYSFFLQFYQLVFFINISNLPRFHFCDSVVTNVCLESKRRRENHLLNKVGEESRTSEDTEG